MDNDPLPYEQWIEDALRTVIQRSLSHVERQGLPGDHHFYVTFRTDDEGVVLPGYLHSQHQEEMTIVLQHQFEGLRVRDDGFSVTLRFNGKPEALEIPYAAITVFNDPAVNFVLQFKMDSMDAEMPTLEPVRFEPTDQTEAMDGLAAADARAEAVGETPAGDGDEEVGANVVALDAFRKK